MSFGLLFTRIIAGCFSIYIHSGTYGNTHICLGEGWCIIYAIHCHYNEIAFVLQIFYDFHFFVREYLCKISI